MISCRFASCFCTITLWSVKKSMSSRFDGDLKTTKDRADTLK
jgi:hypothetical protein